MFSEHEIARTLNGLVDESLQRSPFFLVWKKDLVDSEMSEKFLVTFDSLVKSFPALIAAGAARMGDEETRVTLAVNLFQECGEGDINRTHYAIFRKFLATAGINISAIREMPFTVEWRKQLLQYIGEAGELAVLGALAAGEFLAQPVLSRIYSVIEPLYPGTDKEYFTKHLQLETEHVKEITSTITKQIEDGGDFGEMVTGFKFGLSVWETYFDSLTEFIARKKPAQTLP